MTTTIYIIRHGESEGNINGDIYGADPPLTQKGIEQAEKVAALFESIYLDHVFSSDLRRAYKTAEIVAQKKKLPIMPVKELRERHFGSLEGKNGTYVRKHHQKKYDGFTEVSVQEQMNWKLVEDMETFGEALIRILRFLNQVTETHKGKHLLLASHANIMLSLLIHLRFAQSFNELPYGSIPNTSYMKIEEQNGSFKITELFGITKKQKNLSE